MRPTTTTGVLLAVWLLTATGVAVGDAGDRVAASVGKVALRVRDVERRLRAVPSFQLAAFGSTPTEIRQRFVTEVMAPQVRLAQEAIRLGLERDPACRDQQTEVLREALERQVEANLAAQRPVTDQEVRAYYEMNRARFETPRRIRIWRILVDDEPLARRIIAEAQGKDGPARWSEHARSRSADRATSMRKGDLGFVWQDGRTDTPSVRVDPALYAAADRVRDGDLVDHPVREGSHLAVVWRRGSLAATARPIETVAPTIRRILAQARLREAVDGLVADLRSRHVSLVDEAPLAQLRLSPPQLGSPTHPAPSARAPAAGGSAPRPDDRGALR
jgi:peptidyl-prolyl cis-trans isomerase C